MNFMESKCVDTTLSAQNISVKCREKLLLDSINIDIQSGKITALLGKSGSGKSLSILSFFNLLPSNLTKISGKICLNGAPISPKESRGRLFSVVMQNPISCFNPLLSIKSHFKDSIFGSLNWAFIESLLIEMGLSSQVLGAYPFELSGGMLQRAMIALSLVNSPKFLLLDEPTSDIDSANIAKFLALLDSIKSRRNVGILLVTHDLNIALDIADSIHIIKNGVILEVLESHNVSKEKIINLIK